MCRSSRIASCLVGTALLATATGSGHAGLVGGGVRQPRSLAAAAGPLVLAQNNIGGAEDAATMPGFGAPIAPARPLGFPPSPFVPPPFASGGAFAPPRCPLIIEVGRGLKRAARSRVISGRPTCV